jgi:hypothetical protein
MIIDKEILDFCDEYITIINDKLNELKNRQDDFGNIINPKDNKPSNKIVLNKVYRTSEINNIWKFFVSDNLADIKNVIDYINSNLTEIPTFKFPRVSIATNDLYAGMFDTYDGVEYQIPYLVYVNITLIR